MMADDDPGDEGDEREVELSTIAAIYPELVLLSSNGAGHLNRTASLSVAVEPLRPLPIKTPNVTEGVAPILDGVSHASRDRVQDIHHLSHLPPLIVELSLPEGYPLKKPPAIRLSTEGSWLAREKLEELEASVHMMWEDIGRDQVLYAYIDHLREAAEDAFGLREALQVSPDLKVALLDFDLKAKKAKFERETFECGVCLEPKKGSSCHRLRVCSHVFCIECLRDFYNTCITEGDVSSVKCLAPKCGEVPTVSILSTAEGYTPQIDRALEPSELLQIPLEQETVQRYIKLKRKKLLESDRTTIYCPRQWCQGPARTKTSTTVNSTDTNTSPLRKAYDPDDTDAPLPPPADRLAICQDCTFAFCLVCKASWHGEYYTCFPRSQFELTCEERASEEYIKLHTQPCPTCDARAQKTHGCNHMICFKCDTHFCYLCGAYLEKENPYEHFNNKFHGCYMRLWELEGGEEGAIVHAFNNDFDDPQEDHHFVAVARDRRFNHIPVNGADDDLMIDAPQMGDTDSEDEDEEDRLVARAAEAAPIPPHAPAPPRVNGGMAVNARAVADNARPGRVRVRGADRGAGDGDGAGLRRFLAMVRDDVEDEWDSDEMSGDEMGELDG